MNKTRISRIAGLIYLIVVVTGIFSLAYVPKVLIHDDNLELTFKNIMQNEQLFRLGIASSVICYTAFLLLPVALYKLLKQVNEFYAKLMVLLAVTSVPISFYNLYNKFSILSLISISKQGNAQATSEIPDQVMSYLRQYDNGIFILTVFWGLWLLPFGYLVLKSGFLPKVLGILLMLGCFGYLVNFFGNTLSANYTSIGIAKTIRLLPSIAELSVCAWLLIIGAKEKIKPSLNFTI
ncbi:uncharacterized protein DUF4386 [Lacibacter cauensis]|uniref:Uncharacterized protein DUF4386 n=1 Tax=Lacibacter cauensis TaxID=510947 RepID=A0A562SWS6_9BACT|nr:DUF4386 domain-containing protein [Lacibacter cauensis]TWI85745.1 uncharacterized protein DUF4386 [Lacibacter cauensis]